MPSKPEVRKLKRRTGKPLGRPRKDAAAAAARLETAATGEPLHVTAHHHGVSPATAYAAERAGAPLPAPGPSAPAKPATGQPGDLPVPSPTAASGPGIPRAEMAALADLVARQATAAQQLDLAAALPAVRSALTRGLAAHPAAARALAAALGAT